MPIEEEFSHSLFPNDPKGEETIVWHYMDDWKFFDLIKKQSIYLCRGDKLQDRFEGTYARQQLVDHYRWLEKEGCGQLISKDKKQREENRKRIYINCWCNYNDDLDLMWKSYTKICKAVAIQSRASRLIAICDGEKSEDTRPILVSTVNYCGLKEGDLIKDGSPFDPFVHKDKHYILDKEIRIVHYSTWGNPDSNPEGCLLPVDLSSLIERVVLSPGSASKDAEAVRILLNDAGLTNVLIESSRYDMG